MMKYGFSALALALFAGFAASHAAAQASATATGNALAVGLSYQNIDPDYGPVRASGVGIFANYDFARYVGVTAEVNLQTAFSSVVFLEKTYMVGARGEYHHNRYLGYGKVLVGGASSSNNTNNPGLLNAPGSYGAAAFGAGLEVRLEHHITVRALDYEQQHWLGYHPHGLTPSIFSFGAAYRFQ